MTPRHHDVSTVNLIYSEDESDTTQPFSALAHAFLVPHTLVPVATRSHVGPAW